LDSDHLQILFRILYHVSTRDLYAPIEIHTDREQFRSPATDLISHIFQIDNIDEDERGTCNFAAFIASAYRLSTIKIILSELHSELPEIDGLLQLKQRLRKLWHETRDPACKRHSSGSLRLLAE
jgi:hypothetical protein